MIVLLFALPFAQLFVTMEKFNVPVDKMKMVAGVLIFAYLYLLPELASGMLDVPKLVPVLVPKLVPMLAPEPVPKLVPKLVLKLVPKVVPKLIINGTVPMIHT